MADETSSSQLITEDNDLKFAFLSIMRSHVSDWPRTGSERAPVFVRGAGGVEDALRMLGVVWKTSGLKCLGIIVDADDKLRARWERIAQFASQYFKSVPASPPPGGWIIGDGNGKTFGAWIMPDNTAPGMLETFCHRLVPPVHAQLWRYASKSSLEARKRGATYKDSHAEKAQLHTFLAWADPPGQGIGRAFASGCLDPQAGEAVSFVTWCRTLYQF